MVRLFPRDALRTGMPSQMPWPSPRRSLGPIVSTHSSDQVRTRGPGRAGEPVVARCAAPTARSRGTADCPAPRPAARAHRERPGHSDGQLTQRMSLRRRYWQRHGCTSPVQLPDRHFRGLAAFQQGHSGSITGRRRAEDAALSAQPARPRTVPRVSRSADEPKDRTA